MKHKRAGFNFAYEMVIYYRFGGEIYFVWKAVCKNMNSAEWPYSYNNKLYSIPLVIPGLTVYGAPSVMYACKLKYCLPSLIKKKKNPGFFFFFLSLGAKRPGNSAVKIRIFDGDLSAQLLPHSINYVRIECELLHIVTRLGRLGC